MAQGKLGFGFMRLPVIDGVQENIDLEQLKQMVDEFLGNGFTYFDTSYAYHNGKSEEALRKSVVERYPREQFTIATKLPATVSSWRQSLILTTLQWCSRIRCFLEK